eukprot:354857-Chlamydomonas_euryale.AAC.16
MTRGQEAAAFKQTPPTAGTHDATRATLRKALSPPSDPLPGVHARVAPGATHNAAAVTSSLFDGPRRPCAMARRHGPRADRASAEASPHAASVAC